MRNTYFSVPLAMLLFISSQVNADIDFSGVLLNMACQVDPSSETQDVVFRDTTLRQFKESPGVSPVEKFQIKLVKCQVSDLSKIVKLAFSGEEEPDLPGALKVTGENEGKLAIQLIDSDGSTPLSLDDVNNGGSGAVINEQDIVLPFSAYVQVTPKALSAKSVTAGNYSAIATFKLIYQ